MDPLIEVCCFAPPRLSKSFRCLEGQIKTEPEDFVVREIGSVQHVGRGEHLHCWIEKRNLGTHELLEQLSNQLGIARGEIGYAGMKDRRAVTFQWISLPRRVEERLEGLEVDGFSLHECVAHTSKLRRGQLEGNQFRIRIRGGHLIDGNSLAKALEAISLSGVPNYFGPQRFGREGYNVRRGLQLLRKEKKEKNQFLRNLYLNSVQSALFNRVVGLRVEDGLFSTLLRGDVLQDRSTHLSSICSEPLLDRARFEEDKLSIMAPLFGVKCPKSKDEVEQRELKVLNEFSLKLNDFSDFARIVPGERRPLRLIPKNCRFESIQGNWDVSFSLPAGAYATTVLSEFLMWRGV